MKKKKKTEEDIQRELNRYKKYLEIQVGPSFPQVTRDIEIIRIKKFTGLKKQV